MDFQNWLGDLPRELFYTIVGAILLGIVGFIWRKQSNKREKLRILEVQKKKERDYVENTKAEASGLLSSIGMFMLNSSQFIKFAELTITKSKKEFFPDFQCVELDMGAECVASDIQSLNEAIDALLPILDPMISMSFSDTAVRMKSELMIFKAKLSELSGCFDNINIFRGFLIPCDVLTRTGIGAQADDIKLALRRMPMMIYMTASFRKYIQEFNLRSNVEKTWDIIHMDDIDYDDLELD